MKSVQTIDESFEGKNCLISYFDRDAEDASTNPRANTFLTGKIVDVRANSFGIDRTFAPLFPTNDAPNDMFVAHITLDLVPFA